MRALANLSIKDKADSTINQDTQRQEMLTKLWQKFLTAIARKRELQVWSQSDRRGNKEWHAYDPETGRSICVASETEMRHLIEQSYYH